MYIFEQKQRAGVIDKVSSIALSTYLTIYDITKLQLRRERDEMKKLHNETFSLRMNVLFKL